MSRIEQALKRAATVSLRRDTHESSRERLTSAVPVVRVEDYVAEAPTVADPEPVLNLAQAPREPERRIERAALVQSSSLGERLLSSASTHRAWFDPYRRLAAMLHQMQSSHGTKVLLIASAVPREGKTLTAANLALSLSTICPRPVLLIDGDVHRPSVHSVFGIANDHGLANRLASDKDSLSVVDVAPNLSVLPAGRSKSDPTAGIASDRMRRVLEEATQRFGWVVLDSSPSTLTSEPRLLSDLVDGVILVVRAGETSYRAVQQTIDEFGRERILGVVLNRVDPSDEAPEIGYDSYYGDSEENAQS